MRKQLYSIYILSLCCPCRSNGKTQDVMLASTEETLLISDSIIGTFFNHQKDSCIHLQASVHWYISMVIQFLSHSRTTCHISFYYKGFRLQNWIAPKHQTQYPSSSQMTLFEKHWWRNVDDVTRHPPVHWLSIGNLSRLNSRWKHNWVTKIELSNLSCKTSVFSSHYNCHSPHLWQVIHASQLLSNAFPKYLKVVEIAIVHVLGFVKDEQCFSSVAFLKNKSAK